MKSIKSHVYYKDKKGFHKCKKIKGYKVNVTNKNGYNFDVFIHRDLKNNKIWCVSHLETGFLIYENGDNTRAAALENAKTRIDLIRDFHFKKAIDWLNKEKELGGIIYE